MKTISSMSSDLREWFLIFKYESDRFGMTFTIKNVWNMFDWMLKKQNFWFIYYCYKKENILAKTSGVEIEQIKYSLSPVLPWLTVTLSSIVDFYTFINQFSSIFKRFFIRLWIFMFQNYTISYIDSSTFN